MDEMRSPLLPGMILKLGAVSSLEEEEFRRRGRFWESERKVRWKKLETCFGVVNLMESGLLVEENGAFMANFFESLCR